MTELRVLTFVDSGVLIAAARGIDEIATQALEILDDPSRLFASSVFVRLEVLPKAIFHRNGVEADFYRAFFRRVCHVGPDLVSLSRRAHTGKLPGGVCPQSMRSTLPQQNRCAQRSW